ncbi:MAG TPA: hypothetical protein PKO15_06695 [Fibrobacteria bacterium]|nr:hypothetical protein [Fibrobacteria bacterium]
MFHFPGFPGGRFPARAGLFAGLGSVGLVLSGCAGSSEVSSVTTQRITTTKNRILTYHHRADIPWGMVPVVPPDSVEVGASVSLQVGTLAMAEVDDEGIGTWSPPSLQGSGELAVIGGWFRGTIGGHNGAAPSGWVSIGLMERGEARTHAFCDAAIGMAMARSTVEYRSDRLIEEGNLSWRDTTYGSERHRRWNGFARLSLGLLPEEAGPWATVQLIPSWSLAKWPNGGVEKTTTTTTTYMDSTRTVDLSRERSDNGSTEEKISLVNVGIGWMQRYGSQSLVVGARYSIKDLKQLQMIVQFTSEL